MIMMISIVFLLTTYSSHSYFVPKEGVRRSLVTASAPLDIYSLLISDQFVKAAGQITVPIALAVYFTSTVEKQIQLTKASTDKQITAIDNQILSNKELTEKQIQLNKELTEKQITAIEKQIQSNKEIILANHEISKEMIKSSEARIENILFRFNQNSLSVGERKGE